MAEDQWILQQEGDDYPLTLDSAELEILEGRYRLDRQGPELNQVLPVRIVYVDLEADPPQRRVYRQDRDSDEQGWVWIFPYTYLKPGLWEIHCGDRTVSLRVLQRESGALEADPDWLQPEPELPQLRILLRQDRLLLQPGELLTLSGEVQVIPALPQRHWPTQAELVITLQTSDRPDQIRPMARELLELATFPLAFSLPLQLPHDWTDRDCQGMVKLTWQQQQAIAHFSVICPEPIAPLPAPNEVVPEPVSPPEPPLPEAGQRSGPHLPSFIKPPPESAAAPSIPEPPASPQPPALPPRLNLAFLNRLRSLIETVQEERQTQPLAATPALPLPSPQGERLDPSLAEPQLPEPFQRPAIAIPVPELQLLALPQPTATHLEVQIRLPVSSLRLAVKLWLYDGQSRRRASPLCLVTDFQTHDCSDLQAVTQVLLPLNRNLLQLEAIAFDLLSQQESRKAVLTLNLPTLPSMGP
ncbi:hypothetical protein [Synechococcus elongatus]|uniref:Uncharacterized protein n=1 Tax=Synechococcus elongatus (strain ATCC 33912 / PCC 7942 / FACHB-805) TaxID=1140 RepID=Q31KX7_SYNE7|nr:hypothetical protein [Synechococcus elongatus]ABB58292.1 conserved hypothetical protein [Synechococcus elongatus PCC 7942 = FACHB-805]AJD57240.1 hypothetical protein M744_05005 [Synechococcus elongatus UTEX 2973]MBD2587016.1 hypothetical protein [Synechococcus elongatus FACHB-242]MBD2688087.1 hypothetical protein [Synechococcus elongatus FACHB-1061]MBD2706202.1 hypothetical protein [Synechococcus elongatus PCC 7942 = FACHB-805]